MSHRNWTKTELESLRGAESHDVLAQKLGRSWDSIQGKRRRIGWRAVKETPATVTASTSAGAPEAPYVSDRDRASSNLWAKKYKELAGKYEKALHENSVVEQLVAEIRDLAPRSYSPAPAICHQRPDTKSTAQSAVLLFSDTHVGKVVLPSQTLGFGSYNFTVFMDRLKYLENSIISIRKNHVTMEIEELVVAMLGDMLDGALGHGVEAGQRNTLFAQFYQAGHAIAQFFRSIATHFPKVRIKTVVGNHTRWQNQKRMPTENRYSNLDMFLYALVEALTKDIPNIEWDLNMQPFSMFRVQGFTFHAAHGDHLRGGDKAMGIPSHSIGREISVKTQLFAKHGQQAPHYYVCGHLHRGIQLPHALGDVMINGGFPGLDNYALNENFNPIDPSQRFFFMHPRFGKTAEYQLSLKLAENSKTPPYEIPASFPIE